MKTLCSSFQVINPGCCTGVRLAFEVLANVLHFTCKSRDFGGERCWDRPTVLCCMKAVGYIAGEFCSLQNCCKLPYFCGDTFPSFSGDLLGLLHVCCAPALDNRAWPRTSPSLDNYWHTPPRQTRSLFDPMSLIRPKLTTSRAIASIM